MLTQTRLCRSDFVGGEQGFDGEYLALVKWRECTWLGSTLAPELVMKSLTFCPEELRQPTYMN